VRIASGLTGFDADSQALARPLLRIRGAHNVANACAAALTARLAGVPVADVEHVLRTFAAGTGADTIYANERFEPAPRAANLVAQRALADAGVGVVWANGSLLHDPWSLRTGTGVPYKVYTPFSKAWRGRCSLDAARGAPRTVPWFKGELAGDSLDSLSLQPGMPWDQGFHALWTPGEAGAKERLKAFLAGPVSVYADGRDFPSRPAASRLSPHVHAGELSPRRIWHEAERAAQAQPAWRAAIDKFQAELLWRDFAHHVLANFPHTAERPLQPAFEAFQILTCRIGGRQTVQNYQYSPTCCVQCSLTHTTLDHLSVSLPSEVSCLPFSFQLSMPIRSRLTLTTYSYRVSLSLTIEHSSSRVSQGEGEREEWVRRFSRLIASVIIHCHVHPGTLVVSGICQTKNRVLL
jgi:hypothetical protein